MNYTLKWYVVLCVILIVLFGSFALGIIQTIWIADVTRLSFLIMGIFFVGTFKCGYDILKFEQTGSMHKREIELGWFMSESLLGLGMAGTVIGFIIIMKDFGSLDVQDVSSIQNLIKSLGAGISTALYTTLLGLISSLFLKLQYFLLEDAIEKSDEV